MIGIKNRQLYTLKYNSGKLKACGYCIKTTFDEAHELGEVIALADSQMLRTIRAIRKRTIDREKVERLFLERDELKRRCERKRHDAWYASRLKEIKDKINRTMYVPDYVTVVMEHKSHYKHMFENGFWINDKHYVRLSCSAGQARVSTVVFCSDDIVEEVERRLNNGRDMSKKLAPSKFNAYFGLAGSATFEVSEPKFIVVKDFCNTATFMAHFDTETDWSIDDEIDQREVTLEMNRTDGMGLISPRQAEKWAKELGLEYIPSQFCIRQSFLKGMLCTFPIHEFCEEINRGNYMVDTIYKDSDGEYIKVDLRDYDVIVSESQFKLWDSWPSMEAYIECCHKNGNTWGIAQCAPEKAKDLLTLNYQFIQTLNLKQRDIENLTAGFVDWIEGSSLDNREYMLLFLLGVNNSRESIQWFLNSSDKYWVKALLVNPECSKDPYIRLKIRELIRNRIRNACMGEIFIPGNFQVIVSDPYAFCEHVCGLTPKGLLGEGEFYANYWNERGVSEVDTMRSPLTYRSEHVVAKLIQNEDTEKWYRYCKLGFIVNWYGHECCNWGGSDFDFDIIATTSDPTMIKGVYRNELTVTYDAPKPQKILFDKNDLYNSDTFTFGSIIGSITNRGTSAYAVLPLLEEAYGENSAEVSIIKSRLRQCCVAQSRQIDKGKIGQPVKGIPDIWVRRKRLNEDDDEETKSRKELMNRCLIDKRPYFFKYRYSDSKREHDEYKKSRNAVCKSLFDMSIDELISAPRLTNDQRQWLRNYHEFAPLIESNSPMNLLCKHIEKIDFQIVKKFRDEKDFDASVYIDDSLDGWMDYYDDIVKCYKRHLRDLVHSSSFSGCEFNEERVVNKLREEMSFICSNSAMVANCLVRYLLIEKKKKDVELLWMAYGRQITESARKKNHGLIQFPFPDSQGDIHYLGQTYMNMEVLSY